MKRHFNLPALCGLLVAAGIAITVRHAAAATTWDGAWGASQRPNVVATCTHSGAGSTTGGAVPNGNDASQLVAWCRDFNCGRSGSVQYVVRGQGCTALGTCKYTNDGNGSTGQSVTSTAGGDALSWYRCQMGQQPYIQPPPQ